LTKIAPKWGFQTRPKETEIFYADESGFEQSYSRNYGYSPKGKRVHGDVFGKRFARESVVGAIDADNNFFAGFAFKGYMNSDLFEGWLEGVFVPAIKKRKVKNAVLILDNASHHPKERVQAIADEYGFSVIFLPKYSPDLNPIENFWSWLKGKLRKVLGDFDCFDDALCYCFGRK